MPSIGHLQGDLYDEFYGGDLYVDKNYICGGFPHPVQYELPGGYRFATANLDQPVTTYEILKEAIKLVELSTTTVGGTVYGSASSGDGGTVEFHTVHGTGSSHGGSSSGAGGTFESAPSTPQASPSPTSSYDTSVAAHQSDQQPPPGTQIEDGTLQEEPRCNSTLLAKTFMMVSTTNGGTIVTSRLSAGNSLSDIDKILLASAVACSTAGFLSCFGGYILDRRRSAKLAAILTGIGGVAAIFGFILTMSTIF